MALNRRVGTSHRGTCRTFTTPVAAVSALAVTVLLAASSIGTTAWLAARAVSLTVAHTAESASAIALVVMVVVESVAIVAALESVAHAYMVVAVCAGVGSPVASVIPGASAVVAP